MHSGRTASFVANALVCTMMLVTLMFIHATFAIGTVGAAIGRVIGAKQSSGRHKLQGSLNLPA